MFQQFFDTFICLLEGLNNALTGVTLMFTNEKTMIANKALTLGAEQFHLLAVVLAQGQHN